jgi:hypothetical protein
MSSTPKLKPSEPSESRKGMDEMKAEYEKMKSQYEAEGKTVSDTGINIAGDE